MQQNRTPVPAKLYANISLRMYRDIFNGEFNLGFAPSHMDTCTKCNKLCLSIQVAVGTKEKEQMERELEYHQGKAWADYEMKRDNKQGALSSWDRKARPIGSSGARTLWT